jgi:predicted DNA-binding protein with PD1-like motif
MQHKLIGDDGQARRFVVVFDTDEEAVVMLRAWAQQHHIQSAAFNGIGAFRTATVGYFDVETRDYVSIVLDEQVEVLSLQGTIAHAQDQLAIHAHVVLGKRDGSAHGGHLLQAYVRPTLELIVAESVAEMRRTIDSVTGLPLLNLDR